MASVSFNSVSKDYPGGHVALKSLDLAIDDGEFMVLVGPSGCGKTTALRIVAGLEEITDGELRIGGNLANHLDPRERDVAMVFQNYALYPHMTVFENIAFPLKTRRLSREAIRQEVNSIARLLGIEETLDRRPRTLSGGQRQRVAMGRALVRRPQVFLMDEPLSNLDAKLRVQMRAEIVKLQREVGVTAIYVTHDQIEALTMGTRIAVLRKGVLQQAGAPQEIYDHPRNLFVASFIGSPAMNVLGGRLERTGSDITCVVGEQRVSVPTSKLAAARQRIDSRGSLPVAVGIRPEHFVSTAASGEVSRLRGKVRLVEALGADKLVHMAVEASPVLTDDVLEVARDTDAAVEKLMYDEAASREVTVVARLDVSASSELGAELELGLRPERIHLFDLETGETLTNSTDREESVA